MGPKRAVSAVLLRGAIVQRPVPEHGPSQPRNREALSGVAVRVMVALRSRRALQTVPQLIPAGLLVIVPLPPSA